MLIRFPVADRVCAHNAPQPPRASLPLLVAFAASCCAHAHVRGRDLYRQGRRCARNSLSLSVSPLFLPPSRSLPLPLGPVTDRIMMGARARVWRSRPAGNPGPDPLRPDRTCTSTCTVTAGIPTRPRAPRVCACARDSDPASVCAYAADPRWVTEGAFESRRPRTALCPH